ncbi:hypothetical protein, partial [Bifidobacterium longum]|uniref:hypothetical protein n=1 Tax=Bifidobacterium longum TaxID=216816 RepID=UPI0029902E6D
MIATIPEAFARLDLRESKHACKLFPCCRSASGSLRWGREVGEWWWFENSRACLYYFFIVNDCQFIPRLIACRGGRV